MKMLCVATRMAPITVRVELDTLGMVEEVVWTQMNVQQETTVIQKQRVAIQKVGNHKLI